MAMSRRSFLRGSSGGLAFMAAATTLKRWVGEASAATLAGYAGYRAAVCVFLLGGNDSNNMLIPTATNAGGTGAYDHYARARPNIAIPLGSGLGINPGTSTNTYMLHPSLTKLQGHFEAGRAAFVCNVGPLSLPTNKALYSTAGHKLPRNLFSHSDQQDAWASAVSDPLRIDAPGTGPTGWGGRMADKITSLNAAGGYPEVTSFGGRALFAAGVSRKPLVVSSSGVLALTEYTNNPDFDALRRESLAGVLGVDDGITLAEGYGATFTTALTYAAQRDAARAAAWSKLPQATRDQIDALFVPPANVNWTLHTQLYQVIRDLVAGATSTANGGLGMKREVFSVGFGSFDTHAEQDVDQAEKLAELDFAMNAFQLAMEKLALKMGTNPPQATLFTMSDFGRTLAENSDKGTDHGWGGHMIVLGDRVAGKNLYGRFPNLDIFTTNGGQLVNQETTDAKGRWIPAVTVEQYANGIAYWLGLTSAGERSYLFPNLATYVAAAADTSVWPNLSRSYRIGFMQADS